MDPSDSLGTDNASTPTFRLTWATDIHLNFLRHPLGARFFGEYLRKETRADALTLSGDISIATLLDMHLMEVAAGFEKPLYFVLGNHDYYSGSFAASEEIAAKHEGWLDDGRIRPLTDTVALVGCEGWYDAMFGNPFVPNFGMTDWRDIKDLRECTIGIPFYNPRTKTLDVRARSQVVDFCRARSKVMADRARIALTAALESFETVVFVTHVPPFAEATWHEGVRSDSTWIPWFSSRQMGDVILEVMAGRPNQKLLVLCGHTHSSGIYDPTPNVKVLTGESQYYAPDMAGVLDIGRDIRVRMKLNKVWQDLPPF